MSSADRAERGSRTCVFDPKGRIVALTGPDGGTTRFAYDGDRRVVRVQDPDGGLHEASWEAGRALVAMRAVRADGTRDDSVSVESCRTCSFDAACRLMAFTGADARVTAIEYDLERHAIRIHDPGPVHEVSWVPGRTVTEVFGAQLVERDPASTVDTGRVTTYSYGVGSVHDSAAYHVTTYSYDVESGALLRIERGGAEDGRSNGCVEPNPVPAASADHVTEYRRADGDSPTDASKHVVTYRYDVSGPVRRIRDGGATESEAS